MSFYLGVVGSRRRDRKKDYEIVFDLIKDSYLNYGRDLIVVSGGCKEGADSFAEKVCKQLGVPILIYYPDMIEFNSLDINNYKKKYAIVAYARNTEIAVKSHTLLALVAEDRKGGTEHTIKQFKKLRPTQELLIR